MFYISSVKNALKELRAFLILWSTQSLSSLGSAKTGFALIVWSYEQQGSALSTALLAVCSYAPYVVFSIFAGTLCDRWDKKITMLVSDSFAALTTVAVLWLLSTGQLRLSHLYVINALNGLMNTVQQPASDVATSLLTPRRYYQRIAGMRYFSNSLVTMLTPAFATAVLALAGLRAVLWFDLFTFGVAFLALACLIRIPKPEEEPGKPRETALRSAKAGLTFLKSNPGIFHLILFLAVINLTASMYNAALPAMLLSRAGGGEFALGAVNTVTGLTTLLGSVLVTLLPAPKSRVRTILNTLLFSMSTENFFLAFGRGVPVWCAGVVLGWILIPMMGANLDALLRLHIPTDMQGRVYAARNTFQFFTIPVGYLLGGVLVDRVFEPLMASQGAQSLLVMVFGAGKGSGAAFLFFALGVFGALSCLPFRTDPAIWRLEAEEAIQK